MRLKDLESQQNEFIIILQVNFNWSMTCNFIIIFLVESIRNFTNLIWYKHCCNKFWRYNILRDSCYCFLFSHKQKKTGMLDHHRIKFKAHCICITNVNNLSLKMIVIYNNEKTKVTVVFKLLFSLCFHIFRREFFYYA